MTNAFTEELAADSWPRNSNVAPSEIVADEIAAVLTNFAERRDALVKSAQDRTVTDNDSIGRAADLRSMIKTLLDAVWARAKEVAEPHNRAVNTVKAHTERWVADLATADTGLVTKISDCRTAQRNRAAQQQEEQRQREALLRPAPEEEVVNPQVDSSTSPRRRRAAAAPVVPPPAPVSLPAVRGDYGTRVGDRLVTTYVYADPRKLPRDVLDNEIVAKAIQQVLKPYMKVHPNTKGITASTDLATTQRRPI